MKRFATGVAALACWPLAAAAAPDALTGKSVTVSWNETRSQRDVGEAAFKPVSIPYTFTVYFGTGGHVFKRIFAVAASRRASGADDKVGGGGGANVSFSGNTMVGTNSLERPGAFRSPSTAVSQAARRTSSPQSSPAQKLRP